jgi:hypothetical protein
MGDAQPDREPGPEIALWQKSVERAGVLERWSMDWCVENKGAFPLQIRALRLPHGQFKSDEHRFEPAMNLAPGESDRFQVSVRCSEPQGLVTENAFVIFSAIWSGQAWRIFVRLRVAVSAEGKPETTTESITTQKVGFSEVDS